MPETPRSGAPAFDRALLPSARLEFVVVADTHYMMDMGDAPLEFESRRKQGRRAGAAWAAIGALEPALVVHMGDMVQEFPGRPAYVQTMREALGQIEAAGLWDRCRFVVGNHDIGDRPDPTMPTGETSDESLDGWEARFGPSWQAWDAGGLHFVILNSQLFNTGLGAARRQRDWFEAHLSGLGDRPFVLFLHMPPYLHDAGEPWLGHYDNLGEPDRGWLLGLVRRHRAVAMFSGHVHFQFFDHVDAGGGTCRYFTSPSTSFTRPGFSHLFTGAAPPEQGRDDVPKTGFFLCRHVAGRLDVHRIRMDAAAAGDGAALVTPVAVPGRPAAGGFALGATLRHPLAPQTQVPVAWPSVIRQPVRNDYPLLACVEAGLGWVRTPVADLADPAAARRLQVLRGEGVAVQAVALGEADALAHVPHLRGRVDRLELQLPGRTLPDADGLRRLAGAGLPLTLAPVLPGQPVAGKQHHRTRFGYLADELEALADGLDAAGIDAVVACRLPPVPWDAVEALHRARRRRPWGLQLLVEFPGVDPGVNAAALARALAAAASLDAPLFVEPLVDMDRTMDAAHGLLDVLCNPRPTFDLARSGAALLRAAAALGAPPRVTDARGCEVVALGADCHLLLPGTEAPPLGEVLDDLDGRSVCRLAAARTCAANPHLPVDTPLLVCRLDTSRG